MGSIAMYALVVVLSCISLSIAAVPPQSSQNSSKTESIISIPDGKVYMYNYSAIVSTGQNEPTPFASKFQIEGLLLQKNVPGILNTKYMKLHEIKYSVFNGADNEGINSNYHDIPDGIKDFEEPIHVVYESNNKVKGIKVQDKEAIWSKNMKKSLAAIMQFDLRGLEDKNMLPMAFQTTEKTIHGDCQVDYDVKIKNFTHKKVYYLRRTYEPRKCGAYIQQVVKDAKYMNCKVDAEEDLVTSSEKIYEIEYSNTTYVVKKIISHEKTSYLPWLHRSYGSQYIETKQIFELETIINESDLNLPNVEFGNVSISNDVTFDKYDYTINTDSKDLIEMVKELLITTVDYLKINPIVKEVNMKQANVLEKLHQTMVYLDTKSMHYIYDHFNVASKKGNMSRNLFLEMIPHLGTYAAWNFTKNIIKEDEVEESIALNMLANLPMFILNPNEDFARDMIELSQINEVAKSTALRTAGVLCYSILLHKIYKNPALSNSSLLQHRLDYFNERIIFEGTYQSKILYMMALRNVEVGGIYKYLAPIVRGEDIFFVNVDINKPEKYRIAAMWAVAKSINHDRNLTHSLFWPILSNRTEPLSLRITAYELLVLRNPTLDMNLLMNIYWIMIDEPDIHMFNYHYTSMKTMAESTDPCMKSTSEMFRKVLRLTKHRKLVNFSVLSRVKIFDYHDEKYGHGKTFKIGAKVDEASGIPHVGYYEIISSFARRPVLTKGIYWNMEGINSKTITELFNELMEQKMGIRRVFNEVTDEKVKNLLHRTFGYKLLEKEIRLEFWRINKGYVTNIYVYFENNLLELLRDYADNIRNVLVAGEIFNYNMLDISFLNHYKMTVATDLGMPAIFYNQVPELFYLKLRLNTFPFKKMVTTKLESETRFFHQSFYKMGFYNPFINITQVVLRRVSTDISLPVDMTISFNSETRTLKMILPRIPESRLSVAGIKIQSVDRVEIENDYNDILKTCCTLCKPISDITTNQTQQNNYENVFHSIDTGLEYTSSTSNCEKLPINENEEWFRVFNTISNNVNDDPWPKYTMILSQRLLNFMNAPHTSTCQTMIKMAPSTVYPTSYIELNWRFGMLKLDDDSAEWNIRGSVDTKAASTNSTMRFWDIDMNVKTTQFSNSVNFKIMRKSSRDKNLKVCVEALKEYPSSTLNTDVLIPETITRIHFVMDESDGDQCTTNGTNVKILIKGELLNEQKEQLQNNVKNGSCFKSPLKPLDLNIAHRFDWNCLYQAVQGTTLRNYTIDISYKKIPDELLTKLVMLDDYLRLDNLPHITYEPDHTEPGHIKVQLTYFVRSNYGNITVMNPYYSYKLDNILYGPDDEEDRQNDLVLDNVSFSTNFLVDFYKGDIRPCIVHANDIINDLNRTIPVDLKHWTLMSGDYAFMSYAVFVKAEEVNKVALMMFVGNHVLKVIPGPSEPKLILDEKVYSYYDQETLEVIKDTTSFRFKMVNQLLLIETGENLSTAVKVYYSPYNVIILPHISLDRAIDGMCGHMGSMAYVQEIPLIYDSV